MSSSISGLGNKVDNKNRGKFKTIDINNVYKGTSVAPQKTTGSKFLWKTRLISVVKFI